MMPSRITTYKTTNSHDEPDAQHQKSRDEILTSNSRCFHTNSRELLLSHETSEKEVIVHARLLCETIGVVHITDLDAKQIE